LFIPARWLEEEDEEEGDNSNDDDDDIDIVGVVVGFQDNKARPINLRVSEINYRINSITLVTTTVMREQKVIILEL
jgi:hypothetical protein